MEFPLRKPWSLLHFKENGLTPFLEGATTEQSEGKARARDGERPGGQRSKCLVDILERQRGKAPMEVTPKGLSCINGILLCAVLKN